VSRNTVWEERGRLGERENSGKKPGRRKREYDTGGEKSWGKRLYTSTAKKVESTEMVQKDSGKKGGYQDFGEAKNVQGEKKTRSQND